MDEDYAMDATEVIEGLYVGPCPAAPETIRDLHDVLGVTGLVSLQTDEDLASLGLSWDLMWSFLMRTGIAAERVPIQDFDERALAAGLPAAVDAVHRMRTAGRQTYVHCTAGLNRSPTVVIAYLIEHAGLGRDAAWQLVHSRRRVMPLGRALDLWLARRSQ